jgi:hypothetical protein
VTDQFSVPVDNWTNKINEEGDTLVFKNQWHFSGVSKVKTEKMRYLAIIQVKPDGGFEEVICKKNGIFTAGDWEIKAEMNASLPASIRVTKNDQSASLVSTGALSNNGKLYKGKDSGSTKLVEMVNGKPVFQEAVDKIPSAIQSVMNRK